MKWPQTVGGAAAAAGGLLVSVGTPARALDELSLLAPGPAAGAQAFAPLTALVGLLAWSALAYLSAVALVVMATRLPGRVGAGCGLAVRWVAPVAVRRSLEVALGLSVLAAGPLATGASAAAVPSGLSPAGPAATTSAPAVPDLDWPVLATDDGNGQAPSSPTSPTPPLPSPSALPSPPALPSPSAAPSQSAAPSDPEAPLAPLAPADANPPVTRVSTAPGPLVDPATAQVVVHPGDSLWSLAAAHLQDRPGAAPPTPGRIAQAWPRWWQANRTVIGEDPDLLLPGMSLRPPG